MEIEYVVNTITSDLVYECNLSKLFRYMSQKKTLRTEIEQDSDKNKLGVVEYRCEEVSSDGKLPGKVRAGSVQ